MGRQAGAGRRGWPHGSTALQEMRKADTVTPQAFAQRRTCASDTASPVAPCMASSSAMHSVLDRLPQPCWLKVSSTVSPRRRRISLLPSARSAAEAEAHGYSLPTPAGETKRRLWGARGELGWQPGSAGADQAAADAAMQHPAAAALARTGAEDEEGCEEEGEEAVAAAGAAGEQHAAQQHEAGGQAAAPLAADPVGGPAHGKHAEDDAAHLQGMAWQGRL